MDNIEVWCNLWTQKVELFGQYSIKGDILNRKKNFHNKVVNLESRLFL